MKKRSQIQDKYKWDLSSYFKDEKEFEKTFLEVSNTISEFAGFEGKLDDEKNIYKCLLLESETSQKLGKLYVYASLITKQDQSDSFAFERLEKISSLATKLSALTSFVDVEISALPNEFLIKLQNNEKYPQFDTYFYDILRFKPHMLSKKEEKLLSLMSDFTGGFSQNFEKFDDADLTFEDAIDSKGKPYTLNHSSYSLLLEDKDRTLRKDAMIKMNRAYKKFNNFLASNYISVLKQNKFSSSIRNFDSSLQGSIFSEDASEKVYKTLLKEVKGNAPLLQEYLALKAKQLQLKDFALYDLYTPIANNQTLKIEYEVAMDTIKKATSILGQDYTELISRAEKERWIDVFPNENKDSGAFSWGAYGANPVVLTNYVNNTNSLFTMAHELGHCMHTFYSNQNQPYEKAGYTIFVAEVASTVNEMLLLEYLLKNARSKEEKIYYYDYVLNMVRATIFRQTMFSEFEAFAHEQVEKDLPISKDVLNNYYFDLNKQYFGKNVKLIDEIAFEWSRIPHFYSSFYVYKYATGLISALAITNKILSGEIGSVDRYKNFLKSGSSLPPVELLKLAGVNLEDKNTFDEAFNYVKSIIERWKLL